MKPYKHCAGRQLALCSSPFVELVRQRGNSYDALVQVIDLECYRPLLEDAVRQDRIRKGLGDREPVRGRHAFDPVWILRCLFLQRLLGLSDNGFYHRLNVDVELQDHLCISTPREVPSAKTLWRYREIFVRSEVLEKIFKQHISAVREAKPQIGTRAIAIDSSFVEAPKQRNSREENQLIKQDLGHTLWNDNPHKKRHKDCDARWTKKREEVHYGYKMHTTACAVSKLITDVHTTSASVHDAKVVDRMIPENTTGQDAFLFADAGYTGSEIEKLIWHRKWIPFICEKGMRGRPLTEKQKENNRVISSIRCRIEHIFGFIEQSLGGSFVRSIGIARAREHVALTCLVYNVCRLLQLCRRSEEKPKPTPA